MLVDNGFRTAAQRFTARAFRPRDLSSGFGWWGIPGAGSAVQECEGQPKHDHLSIPAPVLRLGAKRLFCLGGAYLSGSGKVVTHCFCHPLSFDDDRQAAGCFTSQDSNHVNPHVHWFHIFDSTPEFLKVHQTYLMVKQPFLVV